MIHTQFSVAEWLLNLFRKHLTAAAGEGLHSRCKMVFIGLVHYQEEQISVWARGGGGIGRKTNSSNII